VNTRDRRPRSNPATPGKPGETSTPGNRPSGERIRITLDLSREQHRFLRQFALDADSDASSVLRTLLDLLKADSELAKAVLRQVARRYTR
jgi:hypothetical protein